MTADDIQATDDARYLALQARDARFDGCFFTGITSTGIYCRPVCRVRTPKRENCRFFTQAAQAEQAGFRPCLRCRPEIAPGDPDGARAWSMQDATGILALQAARLLDNPELWGDGAPSVQRLAQRLGVSDRHLRRLFESQWGLSPLQYLQTRRLLCAKQLLTDTRLAVTEVARLSGFASVRRFNAVFAQHYALNPSQLRRVGNPGGAADPAQGIRLKLAYRPPYDVDAMLQFFRGRQIEGIETVTLEPGKRQLAKTVRLDASGQTLSGWLLARFEDPASGQYRVTLQVSDSLRDALPLLLARVRALLDLDADPQAINSLLHNRFPQGDGLRVPGSLDGFELAVRAVLGQRISVAAGCTLCARLVQAFGSAIETPLPGLNRLFPTPLALASADGEALGRLGILKQQQAALQAIARAVLERRLSLHAGADLETNLVALRALPGVGDWTAQYIAMRSLRWPDAFPAADVALHKALGVQGEAQPAKAALALAQPWQPWRSYAVIRAWASLPDLRNPKMVPT
jgi:AraC family transcriptional regulator of adaptative response / DNA-3-methyladenine glycosylase II